MRRLIQFSILLIIALTLFSIVSSGFAFEDSPPTVQQLTADGEPKLQDWFIQNGYIINVTADETGSETFKAGSYKMTVLAEFAAYAPLNNLSWYTVGSEQLNYLFYGENVTDDSVYMSTNESFGFCLGSPDGYFYTESSRNNDSEDHALVFLNPNTSGYIVAWEDLWNIGDQDFQDFVFAVLEPVTVKVCYCPRMLNLKSRGRWITAIIKLPKNYRGEDVNISSLLLNDTVPADQDHYAIVNCGDLHLLIVKFDRKAVIELVKNSLGDTSCLCRHIHVSLTVTGRFLDGLPFKGTNCIRVIHYCHCCCCRCHACFFRR
jgi:hypothetical protein